MKMRWMIAAVAALALAVLTLNAPLRTFWFSDKAQAAAAGPACDPKIAAKSAKLNFTLKDINNREVKLSDFKGKVILLDFWATWCGPCKIEIPGFLDLQSKYGKDGLVVIGVSVDDTLDKLRPFVAQYKMTYTVLQGLNRDDFVEDAYGPMLGIPTTFVIGRDGRICQRFMGMTAKEQFESTIKSLL